ncbi:MAG: gliding motility-associated C-terminal domain-containing protein [Chitinophagales bacterium]|nr:gliding motility-associated C-terminal domain-containing protein [Chitinophagales bacterium]
MKHYLVGICLLSSIYTTSAQSFLRIIYPDVPVDTVGYSHFFAGRISLLTSDGGVIYAGDSSNKIQYICKLDASGNMEWSKAIEFLLDDIIENTPVYTTYGIIDADENILLNVNAPASDTNVLLKLDGEGNLLWSRKIAQHFSDTFLAATEEGYIMLLPDDSVGNGINKVNIMYLDTDGNFQYGKRLVYPQWFDSALWNLSKSKLVGSEDLYFFDTVLQPQWGPNPGYSTLILTKYNIHTEEVTHLIHTEPGFSSSSGVTEVGDISSFLVDEAGSFYINSTSGDEHLISKYNADGLPIWSVDIGLRGWLSLDSEHLLFNASYLYNGGGIYTNTAINRDNGTWVRTLYYRDVFVDILRNDANMGELALHGAISNTAVLESLNYQIYPSLIVKTDEDGRIDGCMPFEACEYDLPTAVAPTFEPIILADLEDIDNLLIEAISVSIEDQAFINESYCIPPTLDASFFTDDPFCPFDSVVVFSDIDHFLPTSSEWKADAALMTTSIQDTATFQFPQEGIHEIQHIIEMAGCKDTITRMIEILEAPYFELGADTSICTGDSLLIESGLVVDQVDLVWQDSTTESSILATAEGKYRLEATNDIGCTYQDSLYLSLIENPVFSLGTDIEACEGSLVNILPDGHPVSAIYKWNTGSEESQIFPISSGTYILTITDVASNCQAIDSIEVLFTDPLVFDYRTSEEDFCPGLGLLIEAVDYNPIPLSFYWPDGSLGKQFEIPEAGTYSLIASDGICEDSLFIEITPGLCQADIYIPNAFSPNNDGRNDFFKPFGPDIETVSLTIYNRWGGMVYQESGSGVQWDGLQARQALAAGIYVYQLEYLNKLSLKKEVINGEVLLVR